MSAPLATPAAFTCLACKQPIADQYWLIGTQMVCPRCRAAIEARPQTPWAQSIGQAAVFGLGAAIAGAALWAIILFGLNMQLGIAAVAVGWLVGTAVRKGSGTRSGTPFQVLAVALTVVSLVESMLPIIVRDDQFASLPLLGQAFAVIAGPVFVYGSFVKNDPLSLLFAGIALYQAWRLNAARTIPFNGPHRVAGAIDFSNR